MSEHAETAEETVQDVQNTSCVIVGGGPAGIMMAFLLARKNVPVTLLESHKDFDRDFRGDTVHPSTLEVLDQVGLADRLLQIPHGKLQDMEVITRECKTRFVSLRALKSKFPYVAIMPQAKFLDFMATEARKLPSLRLELGANVQRLLREDGTVKGIRYRDLDNVWHEVRAPLTVAADGRFSKIRSLAGIEPVKTAPPMDVLWFRLPKKPGDTDQEGALYIAGGRFAVMFPRAEEWQIGYIIIKGAYGEVKSHGIDDLRKGVAELIPWLADRADQLHDWKDVTILSVESSLVPCWHQPGLLLIGDAAHVMSPVGGVGINYAIQDAVEAANVLAAPLLKGQVTDADLAQVQKLREFPVKVIQRFQAFIQDRIVRTALAGGNQPFSLPLPIRLINYIPGLRNFPARMIGFGIKKVKVM
jgi:2-polyprenyl-6-methoxyphenol hydroxylase-like FAD-dependent oxidoreductase